MNKESIKEYLENRIHIEESIVTEVSGFWSRNPDDDDITETDRKVWLVWDSDNASYDEAQDHAQELTDEGMEKHIMSLDDYYGFHWDEAQARKMRDEYIDRMATLWFDCPEFIQDMIDQISAQIKVVSEVKADLEVKLSLISHS